MHMDTNLDSWQNISGGQHRAHLTTNWQGFKHAFRVSVLIVTALVLSGCASLSESECLAANWEVLGESDGQQGRPLSQINRYQKDCAQYGVVPDAKAYATGRERGLAHYCTESNGYEEARLGAGDAAVCPPSLQADFRRGYVLGQSVYAAHHVLITTADDIRSTRDEIEDLKSNISHNKSRIDDDSLSQEDKAALKRQNDSSSRRIQRLEDDLIVLAGSVALAIAQYSSAVRAARAAGHDEPIESEIIYELQRLAR